MKTCKRCFDVADLDDDGDSVEVGDPLGDPLLLLSLLLLLLVLLLVFVFVPGGSM